jgi:membrane protein YqaA with SNARE-associated domain
MDWLINLMSEYGYWGMGVLAFLSGSIVPITSEVLLVFFLSVGLNAVALTLVASFGNTLGGITCFFMGRIVSKERAVAFFKITPRRMQRADRIIQRYGYWAAAISFVPVIGETLLVMLGVMRVSWWRVAIVMAVGKLIRYAFITFSYTGVMQLLG